MVEGWLRDRSHSCGGYVQSVMEVRMNPFCGRNWWLWFVVDLISLD